MSHGAPVHLFSIQVRLFFRWLRFVIDVALADRPFVVVNMDETSLVSVRHGGSGMIVGSLRSARRRAHRPSDPRDRLHQKVTLIAAVSDNPNLQPLLPQVVLPKYTQNANPPLESRTRLALSGFPLEFWHGTGGVADGQVLSDWATRLRSVVHTWNDDAFILLLMDCASCHVSVDFLRHLSKLGILTVLVPAKLTWLLQVLDVAVFGPLKKDMRLEEMRLRERHSNGLLLPGDSLQAAADSIRRVVVNRDWSASFDSLGAVPLDEVCLRSSITPYVDPTCSDPALPSVAQLSELVGRPPGTVTSSTIHSSLMRPVLELARQPPGAIPKRGAKVPLPMSAPAEDAASMRQTQAAAGDHIRICESFLQSHGEAAPHLSTFVPARQVFYRAGGPDG